MASSEQSSSRAWSKAPGGHGASSRRGARSRRLQRSIEGKTWRRSTYTTPRRYHRGMAGQCPRGHDGIKLGEVADDTSAKHRTHQAQISLRTGPSSSRSSSRSPWPRSRASEAKTMQASGKQSTRSRGQAESPSLDLSIEHHLSSGLRRGSSESSAAAARRCGRQRGREEEDDAGERRGMTSRADRAAGRVRPEGLAPTGGPGLAEREVRG
jgi:hypothetical protein